MLAMPRTITAAPANLRKCRWKVPVAKLDIAESDAKAGNVPSEKASIVSAPTAKLALAST